MQLTKQILYNLILEELQKGAAYKHKSKKGKESTVKVVDPKNQHGSAVLTKVNPETLDPLSKRVFAVNPEKFEATAEPIKGDAAGDPADDGQCGPGKKFNGRTGEPCPAPGGAGSGDKKAAGDEKAKGGEKAKEMEKLVQKIKKERKIYNDIMLGINNRTHYALDKFRDTQSQDWYEYAEQLMKVFSTYSKWMDSGNEEQVLKKMKQFAQYA